MRKTFSPLDRYSATCEVEARPDQNITECSLRREGGGSAAALAVDIARTKVRMVGSHMLHLELTAVKSEFCNCSDMQR